MSFQSIGFLIFLLLMVFFCRGFIQYGGRDGVRMLLFASFLFYIWPLTYEVFWSGLILLGGSFISWNVATFLTYAKRFRTGVFIIAVCWHIGILAASKYLGMLNGEMLAEGWVPLGLSFFVIQQIWFLKRVYTGEYVKLDDTTNGEFTLYCLFFPTIASGPILRPDDFFPQIDSRHFLRPTWQETAAGIYGICVGMFKKTVLADGIGTLVDNGWASLGELSAPGAWLVIFAYALQLYLDFTGYCDIATGAAKLLGFDLPMNFDTPYRSLSVGDFWKRWHMTLTNFFRECVYIPLGGSRHGKLRAVIAILAVFLISGVWHGAGWTFVLWGALHGVAMVFERLIGSRRDRLPAPLRWAVTFLFVCVAWVFFRAPSVEAAWTMLGRAVSGGFGAPAAALFQGVLDAEVTAVSRLLPGLKTAAPQIGAALLLIAGSLVSFLPINTVRTMREFHPKLWMVPVCVLLLVWSVLTFPAVGTFIYANF